MITRGIRQVASMAAVRLAGMATIIEIQPDCIRFQADSLDVLDQAMDIVDAVSEETGVCVVVCV